MQFYSYTTETPDAPGQTDEPLGSGGRAIDRDLKTLRGVVNRLEKAWPGKSFKVFSFTNIYDARTHRLVHTHRA
jgi:uncharacterized protein YukE